MGNPCKQLLSVRSLSVLLSATLILCSALITVYMGEVGNDAVAKTEDACLSGIDKSLLSAKENVELMADKYMHQVLSDLSGRLSGYTKVPALFVKSLATWMGTIPKSTLMDETFQNNTLRSALWNTFWAHDKLNAGIRSVAVTFAFGMCTHAGCAFPSNVVTVFRYATMYASGYPNNIVVNSEGTMAGVPDAMGVITPGPCRIAEFNEWILALPRTHGKGRPMPTREYPYTEDPAFTQWGKCAVDNSAGPDTPSGRAQKADMMRSAQQAPGMLHWSPPMVDLAGVGFQVTQQFARPDEHPVGIIGPSLGKVSVYIDVVRMGEFFRSVDMPAGSRVYGVCTDPWTLETRTLIGSSHGATLWLGEDIISEGDPGYDPDDPLRMMQPMAVDNKTDPNLDPIVRAHGTFVLTLPGNYSSLDPSPRPLDPWISPDGVLYWTKVRRFRSQEEGSPSYIEFYTVLLVERDIAMETVDRGTRETTDYIAARNKEADDEKKESETVMIIVVSLVLAALLALSVAMSVAITEPLHKLEARMGKVAQMKLDGEGKAPPPSKLKEVRQMQKSFQRLVKNLIEYRNYMPQSLLVGDDGDEVEEEVLEASHLTGSQAQSRSRKTATQRSTVHGTQVASSMQSSKSAAMRQFLQKHTAEGVKKKKCSFLITGMRGFHDLWGQGRSDDKVTHMHGDMISRVVTAVTTDKGCADTFNGDRVLSSFGAVKPLAGHITAACRSALAVRAACDGAGTTASAGAAAGASLQLTCSAVGGQARVGNMGCVGMKKFSCVSSVVTWAYALERFASRCVVGGTALCTDAFAAEDTAGSFVVRVIDSVSFPKRSPKAVKVYELMSSAAGVGEDEWMYQLEEAGEKDPNKLWNQVVLAVLDAALRSGGGAAEARAHLAQLKEPGQVVDAPTSAALLRRVEEIVAAAESYKPWELHFH